MNNRSLDLATPPGPQEAPGEFAQAIVEIARA
jgi:hypothetical protein